MGKTDQSQPNQNPCLYGTCIVLGEDSIDEILKINYIVVGGKSCREEQSAKVDRMRNAPLNGISKKVTFEPKLRAGESERAGENRKCRGHGVGSGVVWPAWGTCVH